MNIYLINDITIIAKNEIEAKTFFNQILLLNSNKYKKIFAIESIDTEMEWTHIDYFKYENITIKKIGFADENVKRCVAISNESVMSILLNSINKEA